MCIILPRCQPSAAPTSSAATAIHSWPSFSGRTRVIRRARNAKMTATTASGISS